MMMQSDDFPPEKEADIIPPEMLSQIKEGADSVSVPAELIKEEGKTDQSEEAKDFHSRLQDMSVPQKIKLAIFGNRMARAFLIRDSNRQVAGFVLDNPQLTEDEVVEFARNPNISDQILRTIANSSAWMKNYQIKLGIVSNPRVPIDLSLRWLKYIQEKDLRLLSRSKNIPQVIATQAKKLLERRGQ